MAIPAEFQEREYESFFIQEIAKLGGFTWSPGQTDENLLGFDGGMWLNPHFLYQFGFPSDFDKKTILERLAHRFDYLYLWHPHFMQGKRLHNEIVEGWHKFANGIFPDRSLNFFVQHKRPYQSTERGAAGDYWKGAYFEFHIDNNQQRRLQQLELQLDTAGVVTYSCAAFMKKTDLYDFQQSQQIIKQSNFVGPSHLVGHSRYTYTQPGHTGFANADPTPIRDETILSRLLSASERVEGSFSSKIKQAGRAVSNVMEEESPNGTGLYFDIVERLEYSFGIDIEAKDRRDETVLNSIAKIMAFNTVNSTSWAIITPPKKLEDSE